MSSVVKSAPVPAGRPTDWHGDQTTYRTTSAEISLISFKDRDITLNKIHREGPARPNCSVRLAAVPRRLSLLDDLDDGLLEIARQGGQV